MTATGTKEPDSVLISRPGEGPEIGYCCLSRHPPQTVAILRKHPLSIPGMTGWSTPFSALQGLLC
jgi:hypothetical protein